jgi:hypothetical protein
MTEIFFVLVWDKLVSHSSYQIGWMYIAQVCFTISCWMHSQMWILHTGYHCAWVIRRRRSRRLSYRRTWQPEGESTEGILGTPDLLSTQKIIATMFRALMLQFNFTVHSFFSSVNWAVEVLVVWEKIMLLHDRISLRSIPCHISQLW